MIINIIISPLMRLVSLFTSSGVKAMGVKKANRIQGAFIREHSAIFSS